jgi:hypothetical protein
MHTDLYSVHIVHNGYGTGTLKVYELSMYMNLKLDEFSECYVFQRNPCCQTISLAAAESMLLD